MTLELVQIPENPATKRAESLLNEAIAKRRKKRIGVLQDELQCYRCRKQEILKKYPREEMKHIPYKVKRKGITYKTELHLCPKHAATYVPQSQRAAHVNGV